MPPDDDVRLWYRATAAFLQSWKEFSELEPHLEQARKRFPDDAVLLLYDGTLHEAYAEPRVQNLFKGGRIRRPMDDAKGEWRKAAVRFGEALRIDPGLTEARVRLSHVLGRQGRHAEAETVARRFRDTVRELLA